MSATANLRRQHDAATLIVSDIVAMVAQIGAQPTSAQAFRLTILLAKLVGTLRIHFAQEDRHLYPSLMASGQGGTAAVARRFFEEMGHLGPALMAFVERWRSPDAIVADWTGYRDEQRAVFTALADRIERENTILYPLADELTDTARGASAA
ncbi:MAG: hemerythrin domain-containing protein [Sphingomonas sp.]|uniref:hemerythrin domain-containing protein n=1 Tax=Sphingomonas sp. TaxID=28214 RepID=UPI001AC2E7E3|nr:hemerythrin domain-containing protein [Sphingomonas sp.]MBN8806842.1 hemerythrin domain-containing protein [Sphingomonas sp.]